MSLNQSDVPYTAFLPVFFFKLLLVVMFGIVLIVCFQGLKSDSLFRVEVL